MKKFTQTSGVHYPLITTTISRLRPIIDNEETETLQDPLGEPFIRETSRYKSIFPE
jgi:hypothetical protein